MYNKKLNIQNNWNCSHKVNNLINLLMLYIKHYKYILKIMFLINLKNKEHIFFKINFQMLLYNYNILMMLNNNIPNKIQTLM